MLDFIQLLFAQRCTFLYIINELNEVSYMSPIYLKPKALYLDLPNSESLFHVFALLLEAWISSRHKKLTLSLLAYVFFVLKFFKYIYISRTYFGESHNLVYSVFEKVLHSSLSRIVSKKFRKAALKKPKWVWMESCYFFLLTEILQFTLQF